MAVRPTLDHRVAGITTTRNSEGPLTPIRGASTTVLPCSTVGAVQRVWFMTVAAALLSGEGEHMHFSGYEDHMLTARTCVLEVRRVTRWSQHPAAGWRASVPPGIAEALGGNSRQS